MRLSRNWKLRKKEKKGVLGEGERRRRGKKERKITRRKLVKSVGA